jgi:hypothetical protein
MKGEEQVLDMFSKTAQQVSEQMLSDIAVTTAALGERPSFEKLMQKLKLLDRELTERGVKMLETYKAETGELPDTLTNGIKSMISATVEAFVKKL